MAEITRWGLRARSTLSSSEQAEQDASLRVPEGVNQLPNAEAAMAYAAAGWAVVPVKAGTKNPGSLLGQGWQEKSSRDPAMIRQWFKKWPHAGIALHTGPSHAVVFDLDKTEDLNDVPSEIAEALRAGLFHRSRGTGDRGHYVFTTDERLGNSAGGFAAWGDVRSGNGVIIASPTIHPVTNKPYAWGGVGAVPPLPSVLRGLLRVGGPDAVPAFTDDTLTEFLKEHAAARAPERLRGPVQSFKDRVSEGESRHGALAAVLPWAFREVRSGYYAAATVIEIFRAEFLSAFSSSAEGQRSRPDAREYENLLRWAAAQPAPAELAESLWDKSDRLRMVRRWAQERYVTSWSLLGVGLLRCLSAIPPSHVLPGIVGVPAQPNLFVGLVGDSGTGKGLALGVADELFVLPETAAADLYPGKPGSGEGIPKMFGSYRPKQGVVYEYTRALMSLPEIDSLKALFGRDSSTLSATLRELWSGETLGNDYSGVGNKVLVRKNRYRACLSIGIQPERSGPLFDEEAGGLPQRFVFAATSDPDILGPTDDTSDLEPIRLPAWDDEDTSRWLSEMSRPPESWELLSFAVPAFVVTEVRAARDRKMRGQTGGLDGHRLLLQEKVALAFAVLHGETDGFGPDHWEMAELFMAHSDAVRDATVSTLRDAARSRREGKARAEGQSAVVREEAADAALRAKTRDRITEVLAGHDDWVAWAVLSRRLSTPQKSVAVPVLADMVHNGEIQRMSAKSGTTTGTKYRLKVSQ